MRKEMGKWVLDIAKYLATAVLISTLFRDIQEKSITLAIGGLSVTLILLLGMFLLKEPKEKVSKQEKE